MTASRFDIALALLLQEETSYRQPPGGPYVRKLIKGADGRRRGAVYDPAARALRIDGGTLVALPTKPDGCAYDDDPDDTGGRTCMGILQREYDSYRRGRGLETRDVWLIEDPEIEAIARRQYWDALSCDAMPAGIDYAMADFGFNCGVGLAARKLQRLLRGVNVDGHVGLKTIDAIREVDAADLLAAITREREAYHRQCRTFWKHGKGWLARTARVEERALAMLRSAVAVTTLPPTERTPEPAAGTPSPTPVASRDTGVDTGVTNKMTVANVTAQVTTVATTVGVVATTAAQTKGSGLADFVLALATSPTFMGSLLVSVCLLVIFREDIRRRIAG